MGSYIDLTGQQFHMLTVIKKSNKSTYGRTYWECLCECGNITHIRIDGLRHSKTMSCGCMSIAHCVSHKMSKTPEYKAWQSIKERCYNKKGPSYRYYGGRGIIVSNRWLDNFQNFYEDMGSRPDNKMSIDRIDTNGNYEAGNCRWADHYEQMNNKRRPSSNSLNKTGVLGVSKAKGYDIWTAKIKQKLIGHTRDFFEACCLRKSAENRWDTY